MSKVFIDKNTGEKVTILKEDTNFYTLDDGVKIKKDTFAKRYEASKEIDVDSFFDSGSAIENLANQLQNQLKSIDPTKISDAEQGGTRIKIQPPVVLADSSRSNISPTAGNQSEGVVISEARRLKMIEEWKLKQELGEETREYVPPIIDEDAITTGNYEEYEMPKPGEGSIRQTHIPQQTSPQSQHQPKIDPLQMMFQMFKNNYDVTINLKIEDKIANPQFIAMVMENVEGDPIEYYSKIIYEKILREPLKLKKEIYNQLKVAVFGEQPIEPEIEPSQVIEIEPVLIKENSEKEN